MSCDVLNLEWSSYGRDREVATSICTSLRLRGYEVVEGSVFDYRYLIHKHWPRLVYLADPAGAETNMTALRYLKRLGVPCISISAEGNYRPGHAESFLWGHNREHDLYQAMHLLWSARARDIALSIAPDVEAQLKVVGGVGFDRYRYEPAVDRQHFMHALGRKASTVIGYATFGFDGFYDSRLVDRVRVYGRDGADRIRRDREPVRMALRQTIIDNPNVLFVLKVHPGVADLSLTEVAGLDEVQNTVMIRDDPPLADCLCACDLWMAYESTTTVEAWMLNKPTALVNPSGPDFPRTDIHRGSVVLGSSREITEAIRAVARGESLRGFAEREEARREVIRGVMQWADGRNHMRAGHYIEQLLGQIERRRRYVSPARWLSAVSHHALFSAAAIWPKAPAVRAYGVARRRFSQRELAKVQARHRAALEKFDRDRPLGKSDIDEMVELNGD